jgi:hypothetical protein
MNLKLTFPGIETNISNDDLLFMQYGNYNALQALASELHSGVIAGCVISWDTIDYSLHTLNLYMTAGVVVINGAMVQVDAQSFIGLSIPNNVPSSGTGEYRMFLTPTITYNPVGNKTYNDGNYRQTMQQTRGILSFNGYATSPTSGQLEIGSLNWTYSPLSDNVYQNYMNLYPIHIIADAAANTKVTAYDTGKFGTLTNGDICVVNSTSGKIEATRKAIVSNNPSTYDFTLSDLTADGSYHTLDISSKVSSWATMALIKVELYTTTNANVGYLVLSPTTTNGYNISTIHTQVNGVGVTADCWVNCAGGSIKYRTEDVAGTITITVCGCI